MTTGVGLSGGTDARAPALGNDVTYTPCATNVELYLHPLLEEPPEKATAAHETWREYESLVCTARAACSECRLLADWLFKAVAQTDVAGYVGCTPPRERQQIRKLIGVKVEAEDFDSLAGARGSRQPVDHADVLRMRAQHPDDSLEQIASRLGCSLSTVKRHLRRARSQTGWGADPAAPSVKVPTMDDVFDAFEQVVESNRAESRVC
ncbi:MAG: sigma-70 family RNA polymerase sigma factor [Nocardioidaceae bacterium]|nr:sigma-70 family RNA polymerase sigma factor [Nocardioidaceae bacterium]